MHESLVELLECPACHGRLTWRVTERDTRSARSAWIDEAEARCVACGATYPVREGIGLFLTPDLPRNDLWQQVESGLLRYLREHPEVEGRLMDAPLESLRPVDQALRGMVLEERGAYAEAQAIGDTARVALYTADYLACYERQVEALIEQVRAAPDPLVDLASGRGMLVEVLARRLDRPIVASDFSPAILRRNQRRFAALGQGMPCRYTRISWLAFDARRTPFKRGAIRTLTTNLGLANIEQPDALLAELRRVVDGRLLAISHFYPEDDAENGAAIDRLGLTPFLFRESALQRFREAGWAVDLLNRCRGRAEPTGASELLPGVAIDSLPVAPTELEWCLLLAR